MPPNTLQCSRGFGGHSLLGVLEIIRPLCYFSCLLSAFLAIRRCQSDADSAFIDFESQTAVLVMDGIMAEFAACMSRNEACDSPDAQELVKTLQKYISANFYCCTNEILAGLGEMYAADERFCSSIDRHADGTALFIREAISVYCTAHT